MFTQVPNTNIADVAFLDAFISDLTEILHNDKAKESLQDLIDEVIKLKRDGTVTIVIDEADIAFGITKWHTAETIKKGRQYLALFTQLKNRSQKVRHFSECIFIKSKLYWTTLFADSNLLSVDCR